MKKRLVLLVAFWVVSLGVIFFFIGSGHGSVSPMYVFSSWSLLLARLFKSPLLTLILISGYYALLIYLNSSLAKIVQSPIPLATLTIHAIGCVIGAIIIEPDQIHELEGGLIASSIVVSAVVVFIYLELDWILARGGNQPAPKGPYWDL